MKLQKIKITRFKALSLVLASLVIVLGFTVVVKSKAEDKKAGNVENSYSKVEANDNKESTKSAQKKETKKEDSQGNVSGATTQSQATSKSSPISNQTPSPTKKSEGKQTTGPITSGDVKSGDLIGYVTSSPCFGNIGVLLFAVYVDNKPVDPIQQISNGSIKAPLEGYEILYGFNQIPGLITPYVYLKDTVGHSIYASISGEIKEVETYTECSNQPRVKHPIKARVITSKDGTTKVIYSNLE